MLSFALEGSLGPAVQAAAKSAVKDAVLAVALDVRENILMNLRGRSATSLETRSGTLMRSWSRFPETGEDSGGAFAKLSSSAVYAAIHEFGGTVVPRAKAFLTMPLDAVRNASGTRTKFGAGELRDNPGLLGLKGTFINKARTAIMGVRPGKAGGLVPLFAIRDSVEIPARPYVSAAIDRTKGRVAELVSTAVERAFGRAGL